MNIIPKTEEEIQTSLLLPKGIYPFKVIEAEDSHSKTSGAEMIKLKLLIYDDTGGQRTIYDNLLEAMQFKLLHFAKTTGLMDKYELGQIMAEDCLGKTGNVEIVIKGEQVNPDGSIYPAKNNVKDYIGGIVSSKILTNEKAFPDDDIPF